MNRHKHPEMYMKRSFNKTYFEGWYYKQVDSTRNHTISFIPSVSFTKGSSLAYLQVIYQKGDELITDICKYKIDEFVTADDKFLVNISGSSFSDKRIDLDFKGETLTINGGIAFSELTRLEYSPINPNIMGFLSYMPFMQCNHGVISMKHSLVGSLNINGEDVSFDGGVGYIEKDWGSSFPKEYIWIQCSHFEDSETSLFFSVANIPYLFKEFRGFICNLLYKGKQYRFATYNSSSLNVIIEKDKLDILIENRKYKVKIKGEQKAAKELYAPKNGSMNHIIKESLKSNLSIELFDKALNEVVYSDFSSHASIEIVK